MFFIGKLIKRWKRQSIVAICLAVILTIATAISAVSSIMQLKEKRSNNLDITSGGVLC